MSSLVHVHGVCVEWHVLRIQHACAAQKGAQTLHPKACYIEMLMGLSTPSTDRLRRRVTRHRDHSVTPFCFSLYGVT